jgi:hypothetical protein
MQEELTSVSTVLSDYYEEAAGALERGRYIVNSSVIKEMRLYLSQVSKMVEMAGNGTSLFLLEMSSNEEAEEEDSRDMDQFLGKYRESNHVPLRKAGEM